MNVFGPCICSVGSWVMQTHAILGLSMSTMSIPQHIILIEGDTPVLHAADSSTLSLKDTAAKTVRSPYSTCSQHISERGTQLVM